MEHFTTNAGERFNKIFNRRRSGFGICAKNMLGLRGFMKLGGLASSIPGKNLNFMLVEMGFSAIGPICTSFQLTSRKINSKHC